MCDFPPDYSGTAPKRLQIFYLSYHSSLILEPFENNSFEVTCNNSVSTYSKPNDDFSNGFPPQRHKAMTLIQWRPSFWTHGRVFMLQLVNIHYIHLKAYVLEVIGIRINWFKQQFASRLELSRGRIKYPLMAIPTFKVIHNGLKPFFHETTK